MPTCIERKILLAGGFHDYSCDLVSYSPRFGILRYILDRLHSLGSHQLEPGDVTHALYWTDRPYTLYTWHLRASGEMLYYFNIADTISLQPRLFRWRDLVVDILIDSARSIRILDEQDLPQSLDPALRSSITTAKEHILDRHPTIIDEVNTILQRIP